MSKIRKPHELNVQQFLKALIYGQPGIGKTTFALSAPSPVLLDFDSGVHRVNAEHQTETLQIEKWQDVLDEMAEGTFNNYKTLIIDTAGKMLDYLGAYIIAKNPKMGKANGALTLQGYGERKAEFNGFIKAVSTMGKNIIFIAHEKEEKDGDNTYKRPEIGGSSGNDLYKELDLIGYMEAIGKKKTISFLPQEKYYAKNACGLNETIELPELTPGKINDFFTKSIIGLYQQTLADRIVKVGEYNDVMEVINEKVDAINGAEVANDVLAWASGFKGHVWSSNAQLKALFTAKCKEVGLVYNPKTKQYNEPAAATV